MEQIRLDEIAKRLMEGLPPSLAALRSDLGAHFDRVLRSGLQHLDLVTREEFDAQTRVLARSRELMEALAARVVVLENQGQVK
jgi:ubiquinone biosynthesis accessory factor UbiK